MATLLWECTCWVSIVLVALLIIVVTRRNKKKENNLKPKPKE
jgi:hypothetical protein